MFLHRFRFWNIIFLYFVFSFLMVTAQESKPITLKSKLSEITVFSDRAEVTREAEINLSPGIHKLIFDDLPRLIDSDSIQVNGQGSAILKDVKLQARYYADIPDKERKTLFDKEQELKDKLTQINDMKGISEGERNFVQRISEKMTSNHEESAAPELDPMKWIKMVSFYRDKQTELIKQIRSYEKDIRTINDDLTKVRQEIKEIGYRKNKKRNLVDVLVEMKKEGTLSLKLRYIVMGPQWTPSYDLRVSTEKKNLNLSYYGLISQNTGEDWNEAAVSLSTAQLNIGGMQPELQPWTLDFYRPLSRSSESKKRNAPMMQNYMAAPEPEADGSMEEESLEVVAAKAEMGGTAAVFHIPGKNTIQSDNQEHKVTIAIQNFPIHLRYSTVPKLAERAYLKAKAENKSDYALLAGETQVFLDGRFVSNSYLDFVAPGSSFWSFLGVDEGIKVERKLIRKYESNPGIFTKQTKTVYEYRIKVTNNRKSEEEIVVWDQLPVSYNQDIKVVMIKPVLKESGEKVKLDENNYLEWFLKLNPGQEHQIDFHFTVEYPAEKRVEGLD